MGGGLDVQRHGWWVAAGGVRVKWWIPDSMDYTFERSIIVAPWAMKLKLRVELQITRTVAPSSVREQKNLSAFFQKRAIDMQTAVTWTSTDQT